MSEAADVIQHHKLFDVALEEDTEDMLRIAAAAGDRLSGPWYLSVRRRLPWLVINLATTFMAAAVIGLFESSIARVVALAAFQPVVAGQGGIGGTQTLTLVVRSIALGDIAVRRAKRLLLRETTLGSVHGLVLGVIVGLVAAAWQMNPILGLVLGLAMLGNMVIAGLVGASVPLVLRSLRIDPAVSSAVVVTTATDVFGFLLYLELATLIFDLLV